MSFLPARKNFKIWRGATFEYTFTYLSDGASSAPVDLTEATAIMHIKDDNGIITTLTTDPDNGIVLGGTTGEISIVIIDTANLPWSVANYELLIVHNGSTIPLLHGALSIIGL